MSDFTDTENDLQERRVCQRMSLHKAMQVEVSSDERLNGESLDISHRRDFTSLAKPHLITAIVR